MQVPFTFQIQISNVNFILHKYKQATYSFYKTFKACPLRINLSNSSKCFLRTVKEVARPIMYMSNDKVIQTYY